jgi:hypothetical protein
MPLVTSSAWRIPAPYNYTLQVLPVRLATFSNAYPARRRVSCLLHHIGTENGKLEDFVLCGTGFAHDRYVGGKVYQPRGEPASVDVSFEERISARGRRVGMCESEKVKS